MSILGFILALLGGVFGAVIEGDEGFWVGLLGGYCLGAIIQLSNKVRQLELRISRIPLSRESERATPSIQPARPAEPAISEPEPVKPEIEPAMYQAEKKEQETVAQVVSSSRTQQDISRWQQEETLFDKALDYVKRFFTDGNVVLKVGLIVLFFGVGFLMKYAYEHSMLPVELRLTGAGLIGIILVVFGWRVRERKHVYALLLQGGGVGVLYLTVFGAAKLYAMIPMGMAFIIMIGLVALSAILAILQNAKYLAIYGAVGGFLAPVLMSTGTGNHVALFSYYALLNAGIVGIAWYRSWRILNLVGFIFTFAIGSIWGAEYYRPEFFVSVEPFLILFFVFFVCIAVLFALRQPPKLKGYVDSTLVFGVPIITFALQAALVKDMEYGMAYSALVISAFYILIASSLWRRGPEGIRLLTEAFLALGVVFGSLAIPLALDGRWTAAAWALEGAAIVWVGVRQHRMLARAFGLLLQFGSGYFFLVDAGSPVRDFLVVNGIYLGALTISLAGLFSSYYLYRNSHSLRDWELSLHIPLLVWGLAWWFGAGVHEIFEHAATDKTVTLALIGFSTGSFLLAYLVEHKFNWVPLRVLMLIVLPVMYVLLTLTRLAGFGHPLGQYGWTVWPIMITGFYFLLHRYREIENKTVLKWQHVIGFWFLMIFFSWEAAWVVDEVVQGGRAWRDVMYALTPAVIMLALFKNGKMLRWPVAVHYDWYIGLAALPVMLVLALIALGFGVLHEGNPWPLVYVPVISPVDLLVAFLLYLIVVWRNMAAVSNVSNTFRGMEYASWIIAGITFLWLNGMIARTIHHWFSVPYDLLRLMHAVEFKATVSVIWTIVALSTMLYASRTLKRHIWFTGLALFALVVAKLFIFDLSRANTLAIIISLLVVGGLTVVFGYYLSPLPPRSESVEEKSTREHV